MRRPAKQASEKTTSSLNLNSDFISFTSIINGLKLQILWDFRRQLESTFKLNRGLNSGIQDEKEQFILIKQECLEVDCPDTLLVG